MIEITVILTEVWSYTVFQSTVSRLKVRTVEIVNELSVKPITSIGE